MPLICATRFAVNSKPVSAHPALLIDAATGPPLKVAGHLTMKNRPYSPVATRAESAKAGTVRILQTCPPSRKFF
jgi:hypothetical protein